MGIAVKDAVAGLRPGNDSAVQRDGSDDVSCPCLHCLPEIYHQQRNSASGVVTNSASAC